MEADACWANRSLNRQKKMALQCMSHCFPAVFPKEDTLEEDKANIKETIEFYLGTDILNINWLNKQVLISEV